MITRPKIADKDDLALLVKVLMEAVLKVNPELKQNKSLADDIVNTLATKLKLSDKSMTTKQLLEPDFLKGLSLSMMTSAELSKKGGLKDELDNILKPLLENKAFRKDLEKLLDPKSSVKNFGQELKKLIDKHCPGQDAKLKEQLAAFSNKLMKELHKNNKDAFKEEPQPEPDDAYTNLFGIINSAVSGGHAVPVPQYIGNGLGFNDWNAYDGSANIDSLNSTKDTQFGDPQSLNAATLQNYAAIDDNLMGSLPDLAETAGLRTHLSPSLTRQ